MGSMDIYRGRLVLLDGILQPATIVVQHGKIIKVHKGYDADVGANIRQVIDAGNLVLMPGLVDSHVHVNEPGRTDWEGYETATKAAAAGGITTIVDMPLNSIPPTTTVENFRTKLATARGKTYVDVAFWGGVVPGNAGELKAMVDEGVVGFKCFLVHSGVDEFPHVEQEQVRQALDQLKGTGSVLLFHAEVEVDETGADNANANAAANAYKTFLQSRPSSMENQAIALVIEECRRSGVRCHIVHLGSGESVPQLRSAQRAGVPITAETCHHYLNLLAEEVPDGATQFKCCPPIRTRDHQEELWSAVREEVVSLVVSDHSPCTADLKLLDQGDFMAAWGGISSLQFGLSLFWSGGRKRGFDIADVNKYMCREPAKLAGLDHCKGQIKEGYDADFVIWDPHAVFTVESYAIQHKNKVTPYLGWKLQGLVKNTIVRGQSVYKDGKVSAMPMGRPLLKGNVA